MQKLDIEMNDVVAYLLLGTNLGNRAQNLATAIAKIEEEFGAVLAKSSIYETAPWGNTNQPGFYNQAIAVKTTCTAKTLLDFMLAVEQEMGRVRMEKWGERLIDIDIIFYGDAVIDMPDLKVPHPLMHQRKFVLVPLAEIAANFVHPIFNEKISHILANLADDLFVNKLELN